jgi:hypothetical protein
MPLKRATIAFATFFGLALTASFAPDPAAAFTAAQKAACGGDAQRLCSSSMSDPHAGLIGRRVVCERYCIVAEDEESPGTTSRTCWAMNSPGTGRLECPT